MTSPIQTALLPELWVSDDFSGSGSQEDPLSVSAPGAATYVKYASFPFTPTDTPATVITMAFDGVEFPIIPITHKAVITLTAGEVRMDNASGADSIGQARFTVIRTGDSLSLVSGYAQLPVADTAASWASVAAQGVDSGSGASRSYLARCESTSTDIDVTVMLDSSSASLVMTVELIPNANVVDVPA